MCLSVCVSMYVCVYVSVHQMCCLFHFFSLNTGPVNFILEVNLMSSEEIDFWHTGWLNMLDINFLIIVFSFNKF